jgi:glutamate dehydrogenase/leucine dehydrogenase
VIGFDPSEQAARALRDTPGIELVGSAEDVFARELDVLAPCAVGGAIDARVASRLRCRVVCGSANNPLAAGETEFALARHGVLYVPDFLANCGGLIQSDAERRGADEAEVARALRRAKVRTCDVLIEARDTRRLPGAIAERMAWERIERARPRPAEQGAGALAA